MSEKTVEPVREYQKPPSTVSFKDIMKDFTKKTKSVDYFMYELVNQEIVIVSVDLGSNTCKAFVNDKLSVVAWKSKTISKHMALIDKFIRSNFQGVRVKVVKRVSQRTGRTYLDFE